MKSFTQMAQEAIAATSDKKAQYNLLKDAVYEATGKYLTSKQLIDKLNETRAALEPQVDMEAFLLS